MGKKDNFLERINDVNEKNLNVISVFFKELWNLLTYFYRLMRPKKRNN